jgi:hypothetical protein
MHLGGSWRATAFDVERFHPIADGDRRPDYAFDFGSSALRDTIATPCKHSSRTIFVNGKNSCIFAQIPCLLLMTPLL